MTAREQIADPAALAAGFWASEFGKECAAAHGIASAARVDVALVRHLTEDLGASWSDKEGLAEVRNMVLLTWPAASRA